MSLLWSLRNRIKYALQRWRSYGASDASEKGPLGFLPNSQAREAGLASENDALGGSVWQSESGHTFILALFGGIGGQ